MRSVSIIGNVSDKSFEVLTSSSDIHDKILKSSYEDKNVILNLSYKDKRLFQKMIKQYSDIMQFDGTNLNITCDFDQFIDICNDYLS